MTSTPARPASRNPLLDTLGANFAVFRECRPLALGIHKAIIARMPELDAAHLRLALRMHTASTRYLKALQAAGERFDLDGKAAGEVTAEQREVAATTLRERFRKQAERRKTEELAKQAAQEQRDAQRKRQEKLAQLAARFNTR